MDERPGKLIARMAVTPEHQQLLVQLHRQCLDLAAAAGKELQYEFGKTHFAIIVGCNQFLRIHRSGDHEGLIELWQPDVDALTTAGFRPGASVSGQVFRMFGWQALHPTVGDPDALATAVKAAFEKAAGATSSQLL